MCIINGKRRLTGEIERPFWMYALTSTTTPLPEWMMRTRKKEKNTRTKEETSPAATPCRFYAYLCVRICQLHTLPAIYIRKEKGNGFSYLRLSPHYRKKKNFLLPPHQGVEKKEHCLWQRPTQTRVGLCRESCPRRLFSRADEKD